MDERLSELIAGIRLLYRDASIYLFGSHAKHKARTDSDYDLIIISKKFSDIPFPDRPATIWRHIHAKSAADLVCFTPDEFRKNADASFFLQNALRHAVPAFKAAKTKQTRKEANTASTH